MNQLPKTIVDAITPTQISDIKLVVDVYSAKGQIESFAVAFGNQSPIKINAQSNQEYRFSFDKNELAPEQVSASRDGNDLWLNVGNEQTRVASIIIEDYFSYPNQHFFGLGKDGVYHQYLINHNLSGNGNIWAYQLYESQPFQPSWLSQHSSNQSFFSENKFGLMVGGLLGLGGVIALGSSGGGGDDNSTPSTVNNKGNVSIIGQAKEGETLTANISDANGVPSDNIRYQWQRDGENITNATKSTYEPIQEDVGKKITVIATYTDSDKNFERLTSDETAEIENTNDTAKVTVEGTLEQNQVLTASVTDEDGLPEDTSTISYTWFANNVEISSDKTDKLTLSQNEVGKRITVQATFKDAFDNEESVRSERSETTVENVNDVGVVAVEGKLQPSEVLEAKVSDADGINTFSLRYQWYADDVLISGANSSKYTLTTNDVGKSITVKVSYTDRFNNTENITSIATEKVGSESTGNASAKPSFALDELLTTSQTIFTDMESQPPATAHSATTLATLSTLSSDTPSDTSLILPII